MKIFLRDYTTIYVISIGNLITLSVNEVPEILHLDMTVSHLKRNRKHSDVVKSLTILPASHSPLDISIYCLTCKLITTLDTTVTKVNFIQKYQILCH